MHVVLRRDSQGISLIPLADDGTDLPGSRTIVAAHLPGVVAEYEAEHRPRWVWDDTSRWYPALLAARVRVERCVDLRLSHTILRNSALTRDSDLARSPPSDWDAPAVVPRADPDATLFDLAFGSGTSLRPASTVGAVVSPGATPVAPSAAGSAGPGRADPDVDPATDPVLEFRNQRAAIAGSGASGSLGLLLAAESAGALIAAEMRFAGLPWSVERHNTLLTDLLGARPAPGRRPANLEALLARVRAELDSPELNPDSPTELLRALRRAGLVVTSTRSWDLQRINHPAIPPLLEFKKLSRLLSANGWHWVDTWVADGRFRPDYVPGGVVTGRWATSGGGALQLPKQVRGAVVPDAGWKLIVADAAQLEPRILTGLAGDQRMAEAGRGDLYEGIVASGAVATRAEAKVAMLGAMYGATTGESGRLLPRLARAYPKALALVEAAARAGERGEIVSTRLGRSSPLPGADWRLAQRDAADVGASEADRKRALSHARSWGRFTRNFIVQGTAAEWALCWMGALRNRLWALEDGSATLVERPHLVFFLHDEVMVHAPAHLAEAVATEVRAAAEDAGRLLFGAMPVSFPVTVAIVDSYADAK
ncbi:bifunctional 3'-5' exonuclease/DNA polymerase [Glaciihabitans tibetensis]|uniref:bifunctional 3'-5' exonuclease/DNA polymerase n=1 Tax=Glaciihabitans tibetensis TaxID=1266600 RepID=UPI000D06C0A3|nr:bifunctional 3'-5' exonuclease/DNA polymerase [Glaciihabitans tibetensis]